MYIIIEIKYTSEPFLNTDEILKVFWSQPLNLEDVAKFVKILILLRWAKRFVKIDEHLEVDEHLKVCKRWSCS